jgi:hypothetical protein
MATFPCRTCGGSYEADVDTVNPTADDFQRLSDAQAEHITGHPDSVQVAMPPAAPKRDWVGCRCKGTCQCRRRASSGGAA